MRGQLCLIGAGLLLLSGCAQNAAATTPVADPVPVVVEIPAQAAGGACRLLDFKVIERVIGTRFDVSAASQLDGTQSCVVRAEDSPQPDLELSVTPTAADASIFRANAMPKGAKTVSGLGKVAYRASSGPGKGHGAGVEIGWLGGDGQIICLRYNFAAGRDQASAEFAPKLLALAKKIDADAS